MTDCLELIIFAGLILLGLEPGDALRSRADIEFHSLAIDFDLSSLLPERVHCRRAGS